MMGWYCPVNKCECDRDLQRNGPCLSCPYPYYHIVEPHTYKPWSNEYDKVFHGGYAAGHASGILEALKTIEDNLDKLTAGEIISAIRALVPNA